MNIFICLVINLLLLSVCCTTLLTNKQLTLISTILQHNNTTPDMKISIQKILFKKYYTYAFYCTNKFYKKNPKLLINIKKRELLQYAMLGLLKACHNFNGKSDFSKYLKIYITGYLYKGITDCNPICLIPHRLRINKEWRNNNLKYYYNSIKGPIYSDDDYLFQIEKNNCANYDELKENIRYIVNNEDPFSKRMFYLRYDFDTFTKKYPIKTVAELSCCSEEYVRIKLNNIYKKIYIKF